MASIEIRGHELIVHVGLLDRVLSLRGSVNVPLMHVRDVHIGMPQITAREIGEDFHGTFQPGRLVVGTMTTPDRQQLVYCDVRNAARALVIELDNDRYARLAVEVDEPQADKERIDEARARLSSEHPARAS